MQKPQSVRVIAYINSHETHFILVSTYINSSKACFDGVYVLQKSPKYSKVNKSIVKESKKNIKYTTLVLLSRYFLKKI